MKIRFPLVGAVLALALTAAGPAAAQATLTFDAPAKFVAAGKTLDAGKYEVQFSADRLALTLLPAKGAGVELPLVTRLAAPEKAPAEDRVVFDKVGDAYYLSEIWAGADDGYLVHATKEKHAHHVAKAQKKAAR